MQLQAWHEYYKQYPFYKIVASSVTLESLRRDWQLFIEAAPAQAGALISGGDKQAFVAVYNRAIVGVGAVSAYIEGKWPQVDQLLHRLHGGLPKVAKFQELYVDAKMRGCGIGHHLSIVRADAMLELGYSAIFLTTYADAHKTNEFHQKNNLQRVCDYMSLQTFADGQRVSIACFLNTDLRAYRDAIARDLDRRIALGKALSI